MHVMERVIENLRLVLGESEISIILRHAEMIVRITEQGPVSTWNVMMGIFKGLFSEEGAAVILIDLPGPDGVIHSAISVDEIASISRVSEIKAPSLQ